MLTRNLPYGVSAAQAVWQALAWFDHCRTASCIDGSLAAALKNNPRRELSDRGFRHGVPLESSPRREPWVAAQIEYKPRRGERISAVVRSSLSAAPVGAFSVPAWSPQLTLWAIFWRRSAAVVCGTHSNCRNALAPALLRLGPTVSRRRQPKELGFC